MRRLSMRRDPLRLLLAGVAAALLLTACSEEQPDRDTPYFRLAKENMARGTAFLEKNAEAEGVVTRPSGLQYRILHPGEGERPTRGDAVTVHYTGTFINGEEFDSSRRRGEPATFPVDGVIPGWTEALTLMREGARWQLFIPSDLAYGPRGTGKIGPNRTLVFDVELLDVNRDS